MWGPLENDMKYYDIIYKDYGHKAIPFYENNPKTIIHE